MNKLINEARVHAFNVVGVQGGKPKQPKADQLPDVNKKKTGLSQAERDELKKLTTAHNGH